MKLRALGIAASVLVAGVCIGSSATAFKWAGGKEPAKHTIPKTGKVDIGEFINLGSPQEWGQVIYNIANKYPGAIPWVTWGVGTWPEFPTALTDDQHQAILSYLDTIGANVYLEVRPGATAKMVDVITANMTKFGGPKHKCVKGFGVDLEFYKAVTDADAKAMDDKLKTFDPTYRLFFKHWETAFMPPTYRGKGDLIFICTSSEDSPANIIKFHSDFANHFATGNVACGFQIGYPADEPLGSDHVHGGPYDGWSSFKDPIKDMGDGLLKAVTSTTMDLGLIWVTVKSDRIPWDLTKGATIPTSVAKAAPSRARFLRVEAGADGLSVKVGDATPLIFPAAADIMGRKVPAQAAGMASGRYFLRINGENAFSLGLTETK